MIKNNNSFAMVSQCYEDYLEKLLELEKSAAIGVRNIDLADVMNVSKASVHKAMAVLKKHDYIKQEHYGVIVLTDRGRDYAEKVKLRHLVIKGFLVDILCVEESVAEEDACKMEHIISFETFDKLKKFMSKL